MADVSHHLENGLGSMHTDNGGSQNNAEDKSFYSSKAKQFVGLHDQVEASVDLLDSLETFLSSFQKDLSAVSGQISELQDRSKGIENRLKARRKIEKPLSSLLSDLCIPPPLATLILDTDVGEHWLLSIIDFEHRLQALVARKRVKAARDLAEVAEGVRIVAATKIRAFFMALIQPIRSSMSTNMQVLQMSVLVKYKPLYAFLQRHASSVAQEIQRAYVAAARVYYETGFRRYTRGLSSIKARTVEKSESIVANAGDKDESPTVNEERLAFSKVDGAGVTLGFLADNKTYKEPVESLFRSCLLVLMDNATAEYSFLITFFSEPAPLETTSPTPSTGFLSPASTITPFFDRRESVGSEFGGFTQRQRAESLISRNELYGSRPITKEEQSALNAIWKQIMEPSLGYCQTFATSVLDPPPPVVPLLTMIRLNESVIAEVQTRDCAVLESFVFGLRLQFWPVFQKLMTDHIESLGKLSEAATGGYFRKAATVTDAAVQCIAHRYITIFSSFVILTDQEEETVIFSNLNRLRHELTQLIITQSKRITDTTQSATYQSVMFDTLLRALRKGQLPTIHQKAQVEIAYWRGREEEARRRITSTRPAK